MTKKNKKIRDLALLKAQYDSEDAYDRGIIEEAIETLEEVEESKLNSQLLYNLALYYSSRSQFEASAKNLKKCIDHDRNMAVAFVQLGRIKFQVKQFEDCHKFLVAANECLRTNEQIDYRPLNLNIILHKSDVLYNLAICCLALNKVNEFREHITHALETAQDIVEHAEIRNVEKVKDESDLNYEQFKLIEMPKEIYRVSKKSKKTLTEMFNQPKLKRFNTGIKKTVIGGDGQAGFNPDESRRANSSIEAPMSAKLSAMLAKEYKMGNGSPRPSVLAELYGSFALPAGFPAEAARNSPPSRPPPSRTSQPKDSPTYAPIQDPDTPNTNDTKNIKADTEDGAATRVNELKGDNKESSASITTDPENGKEHKRKHKKSSSKTSRVSTDKKSKPFEENDPSSLSQFSEGIGENKIQVNHRKDEKRLEVKIPNDCNGLNRSIRLAVKVNLDLELEIDRNYDFDTAMLHLRDQLHSIASLANPHSTTPRLYEQNGDPVIDDECYKQLTDKVNSVNLFFK